MEHKVLNISEPLKVANNQRPFGGSYPVCAYSQVSFGWCRRSAPEVYILAPLVLHRLRALSIFVIFCAGFEQRLPNSSGADGWHQNPTVKRPAAKL
jgi:hypothetical protein